MYVYRFKDCNNKIMYIGKTNNLKRRVNTHDHLPDKCYELIASIEYIEFDDEKLCDYAERYYISKYKPFYNKVNLNCFDEHMNITLNHAVWTTYTTKVANKKSKCIDCYGYTKTIKQITNDIECIGEEIKSCKNEITLINETILRTNNINKIMALKNVITYKEFEIIDLKTKKADMLFAISELYYCMAQLNNNFDIDIYYN